MFINRISMRIIIISKQKEREEAWVAGEKLYSGKKNVPKISINNL